jgi:hypothetical protein
MGARTSFAERLTRGSLGGLALVIPLALDMATFVSAVQVTGIVRGVLANRVPRGITASRRIALGLAGLPNRSDLPM